MQEWVQKAPLPKASKRWDTSLITNVVVSDALGANQPASTRVSRTCAVEATRMRIRHRVLLSVRARGSWLLGDGGDKHYRLNKSAVCP
jgi:hypothetical protein